MIILASSRSSSRTPCACAVSGSIPSTLRSSSFSLAKRAISISLSSAQSSGPSASSKASIFILDVSISSSIPVSSPLSDRRRRRRKWESRCMEVETCALVLRSVFIDAVSRESSNAS